MLTTLASIYLQRQELSKESPEDRFWRSRRFGNAIQRDEDEPPSIQAPLRWPHVRSLLGSLQSAIAAPGNNIATLLALNNAKWIKTHATKDTGINGVGPVWGTVTARERFFYVQYFGGVVEPSTIDAGQPIGAGAARGFSWVVSKHDAFDDRWSLARYKDKDMIGVLTKARDDSAAYSSAYKDALAWLDAQISDAPEADGVRAALRATRTSDCAISFLESTSTSGPPPFQEWEEGLCDGCEQHNGQTRKHLPSMSMSMSMFRVLADARMFDPLYSQAKGGSGYRRGAIVLRQGQPPHREAGRARRAVATRGGVHVLSQMGGEHSKLAHRHALGSHRGRPLFKGNEQKAKKVRSCVLGVVQPGMCGSRNVRKQECADGQECADRVKECGS